MSQFIVLQPNVSQGTVTSTPQAWEAGKTSVSARGLLSDQDLADNTKSLSICLEQSFDGGTNWASGPKAGWTGGATDPFHQTTPPTYVPPNVSVGFGGSNNPPTHIRVRLDLTQPISVGVAVDFA